MTDGSLLPVSYTTIQARTSGNNNYFPSRVFTSVARSTIEETHARLYVLYEPTPQAPRPGDE